MRYTCCLRWSSLAVLPSLAGVTSYSRTLWKADNYNSVRHERDTLKQQFTAMQTTVKDTNERLDSLQSLATDVAMTYGFMRLSESPFGVPEIRPLRPSL